MLAFASEILTKKLSRLIIGQESAIESVILAVCENFEAYASGRSEKINNILLMGPTGSGKTEMSRKLSIVLKVPFVKVTIADYTLTGYHGRDPQEIAAVDFKEVLTEEHCKRINEYRNRFFFHKKTVEVLKSLDIPPLRYKIALEFLSATVFLEQEEVIEEIFSKYGTRAEIKNAIKDTIYVLNEIKKSFKTLKPDSIDFKYFREKPFGIIFVDEIDKILIKERNDGASFYRPLQNFMLTMIEGAVVTSENGDFGRAQIDTSHITFILAGAFSEHSPDEFIPELKGRLNVKVRIKELEFEDYLKIANLQKFDIPEVVKDKLVVVEPTATIEIARICEELNGMEYLGARRLKEIVSKVNRAINRELRSGSSFPIVVDGNFVRWAVSFEPPCEEIFFTRSNMNCEAISSSDSKKISELKVKEHINDSLVKELVSYYEEMLREREGKLELGRILNSVIGTHLRKRDSKGKTVLEYLIEKGVIKAIDKTTSRWLKRNFEKKTLKRILKRVNIVEDEFPEDMLFEI